MSEGERRLAAVGVRRIALFVVSSDPDPTAFWTAVGYVAQQDRRRLVKSVSTAKGRP